MASNKVKVFLDLNVVLDVIQRREPFVHQSARVLGLIEQQFVEGYIAAHSITTLFYLIAKYRSPLQSKVTIADLLKLLLVARVDHSIIEKALSFPMNDFADAVQLAAAIDCDVDYLVTRDPEDFKGSPIPVLKPVELIALFGEMPISDKED